MAIIPATRKFGTCHGYKEYKFDRVHATRAAAQARAEQLRAKKCGVKVENAKEEETDPSRQYRTWYTEPKVKKGRK